jgi:cupin 2 domain-containing protein
MDLHKGVVRNIFETVSLPDIGGELFDTILERGELEKGNGLKLERILSFGAATPKGKWYDQVWDEWVMVVLGEAVLAYKDGTQITLLGGDYLLIPAHTPHRVTHTTPDCVWLALHLPKENS